MDRLIRSREGFTLIELVIAIALGSVILLASSNLLINFGKFTSNVIKAEASLMGTSLGSFEEIIDKLTHANRVVVGAEAAMDVPSTARPAGCLTDGTCIQIRIDTGVPPGCVATACAFTPMVHSDDTVYNYWKSGSNLYKSTGAAAGSVIATDLTSLSFTRPLGLNTVCVQLGLQAVSGATTGVIREALYITVALRGRSA